MKKLLNKKNNKGFSLVELIVVVLIMGIIAVALAPQIMKWVDTSKKNSDAMQAKDIESFASTAVADWQSTNSGYPAGTYTIINGASAFTTSGGASGLVTLLDACLGGKTVQSKTGSGYTLTVGAAGGCSVAVTP